MAEALDQAVETVEPDSKASLSSSGGDKSGAPVAEAAPAPDVVPAPAPVAAPTPAPTPAPAPKTNGIPEPERTPAPAGADQHPPATLKNRYLIFPALPLANLDSPTATAYSVEDRREPGRQLFALVCTPGLPTRTKDMTELRNHTIHGLLPLIDFGPVPWSPLNQSCMIVILERPIGGRLMDSFGNQPITISEYELGRRIMEPLIPAIAELAGMSMPHRALRLDNLFYMDKECRDLVLGECVTSPHGHDQPSIYEPLERAMAMPAGRGVGATSDDLYALGVMTVFLLLGHNPVAKLSDDELIDAKTEFGTYQCLCGNERIPMQLIEPLRGLLSDDSLERWDLEALELWVSGQKKTPIQRRPATKPKSALKFAGHEHVTARTIAYAFSKNITEAAKLIRSGKLELWLRQSLGDTHMADGVVATNTVCKVKEGTPDGSDDVLVSKVCVYLDPHGPIHYKNFSFMPDGFGPALAVEYLRKGNFQIPAELLARDLLSHWFMAQEEKHADVAILDKSFQSLKGLTKINEVGYGMERCLYHLNRTLPCQSEIFQQDYVDHIEDLLPALDAAADRADTRSRPMDKHIASYIATHFKFDIQPHLKALSDPKEEASLIGMLSLFALMQWRMKDETLFGLSSWLGGLLQPAIGTYHSRSTRRTIEKEIPALVRQGSLPELFDLIDNAERRHLDTDAFEEAQTQFEIAETEIQGTVGEDIDQEEMALQAGEKTTAMFSIVMSMIAIAIIIFVKTL